MDPGLTILPDFIEVGDRVMIWYKSLNPLHHLIVENRRYEVRNSKAGILSLDLSRDPRILDKNTIDFHIGFS
jgi:hypothetical protein